MAKPGRITTLELQRRRNNIGRLFLAGASHLEIQQALANPGKGLPPVFITIQAIKNHIKALETEWASKFSSDELDAAVLEMTARLTAEDADLAALANQHQHSALGVAYHNARIRNWALLARIRGFFAPKKVELSATPETLDAFAAVGNRNLAAIIAHLDEEITTKEAQATVETGSEDEVDG